MKLKLKLLVAMGWAWLMVSGPASAFSIATAPSSSIEQGGSVTLTLSGTSTGLLLFSADVDPDENVLQFVSGVEYPVAGATSGGPPAFDSTLGIASYLLLSDDFVTPFDVGGDIFAITFQALSKAPVGPTTVNFTICATEAHCSLELLQLGVPGYTKPILLSTTIDIRAGTGGNIPVPEPASLWLAVAALVAGGLVFRSNKASKRS